MILLQRKFIFSIKYFNIINFLSKMKKVFIPLVIAVAAVLTNCDDKKDPVPLAGFTLSENSVFLTLEGGSQTSTLVPAFVPADADNKELEWSTSAPAVATVADGVITAVGTGYATITAKSKADATLVQECNVRVMSGQVVTKSGDVEGTWTMGTVINVTADVKVPSGKSLTVEEGCEIIFAEAADAILLIVEGSLYCKGTEENPVLFTVDAQKRTAANRFAGIWGGIVFGNNSAEAVIDHAIIEYTGGTIRSGSPALGYEYKVAAGEAMHTFLGGNVNGKYVITNSVLRYSVDNHFYLWGGNYLIANNYMIAGGETGGDNFAPKSGCKADFCFNVIFAPNTNGFKLSSSQSGPARPDAVFRCYNNTMINAGWRRDGVKGGGIYVEKDCLASVFNNLMVNCKYRSMYLDCNPASVVDYNYYCAGTQASTVAQDGGKNCYETLMQANSNYKEGVDANGKISASAGNLDPMFENYGFNTVPLNQYEYSDAWDFHLKAGSPALTGSRSDFSGVWTGFFVTTGLTVGGKEYKSPAPAARFGAFGTK